jgi:hypothetical protein
MVFNRADKRERPQGAAVYKPPSFFGGLETAAP